jgi:acetate kinase
MPAVARVLPLPQEWRARGIERYGFHGLSCESIVRQLAGRMPERLIIAHLGSGASVTAVREGRSIDTSMGMTPTGGIIMATRSGDLDPGVLVYLAREGHLDAQRLEALVDRESGLLGLSGVSGDMRDLHRVAAAVSATTNVTGHPGAGTSALSASASPDARADAALAIDMFCYSAAKQIAAMSAVLGGAEMIVFTGGIGEHDPDIRARICSRLASIGVQPDGKADAPCQVRVLPSEEDAEIARQTHALYQ